MKEVVILTTKYSDDKKNAWLTNELAYALKNSGHSVSAVVFSWMSDDPETRVAQIDGIKVVRIKMPDIFYRTGFVGTAFKVFLFPYYARRYLRAAISRCDLVIASTPCITVKGLTSYFRRKFRSKSYLILWDFFPFYLRDLGLVRNRWFFKVLHFIENRMYTSFDRIGCMTRGNVQFLMENYSGISADKVEILHLWADQRKPEKIDRREIRRKYNLPERGLIAVYGGAMSVVQELDNLLDLAALTEDAGITFLFVGQGTERERLLRTSQRRNLSNVIFLDYVPRDEYEGLVSSCDIGLISLSSKLTVPSFPSKSIDYFKVSLPVLASVDPVTDFGWILENEICGGFSVVAGDTYKLKKKLDYLASNPEVRLEMGRAGRVYYEANFDVKKAAKAIESII